MRSDREFNHAIREAAHNNLSNATMAVIQGLSRRFFLH